MFAKVNDVELYYEVKGSGRPLILLHGNGEDHTIYDVAEPIISEHFTCYFVDSRGHGESTKTDKLDYELMADDIMGFIKELKLEDVSLFGFSDGGIIGLIVASKYPTILKNLVVGGANYNPSGIKKWVYNCLRFLNFFHSNAQFKLMLEHPNISDYELSLIKCRTLILAGTNDLVMEEHTKHLASQIENSELKILKDESHTSYVVHSDKIAEILIEHLKDK
mgnify:FL=1